MIWSFEFYLFSLRRNIYILFNSCQSAFILHLRVMSPHVYMCTYLPVVCGWRWSQGRRCRHEVNPGKKPEPIKPRMRACFLRSCSIDFWTELHQSSSLFDAVMTSLLALSTRYYVYEVSYSWTAATRHRHCVPFRAWNLVLGLLHSAQEEKEKRKRA